MGVTPAVWDEGTLRLRTPELARLLHDCVHAGASIGFVLPFTLADAEAYWLDVVAPLAAAGSRVLLVIEEADVVVGSVQLGVATPANQPHRADVTKLLVHPGHRRAGVARRLMAALEQEATDRGRTLLTLDTTTGSAAQPLYASLGYVAVGEIPDYARHAVDGRLEPTTIMYKQLARTAG